jgi:hypothetical protein
MAARRVSWPLSPAGPARRGQLVLVGTRYSYVGTTKQASETGELWELAEVTSITRGGEIKRYRPLSWDSKSDQRVAIEAYCLIGIVDASALDRDVAVGIAEAHTWPSGGSRPWDSFAEAREALRPARPAAAGPVHAPRPAAAREAQCPRCNQRVPVTTRGTFRVHHGVFKVRTALRSDEHSPRCPGSGTTPAREHTAAGASAGRRPAVRTRLPGGEA